MIETPTGVANAYDIASVPGVDVVIIGNNDLSSFSGFPQTDDRYQKLMNEDSRRHTAGRQNLWPGQRRTVCEAAMRSARMPDFSRTVPRTMDGCPGPRRARVNPNAPPPGEKPEP